MAKLSKAEKKKLYFEKLTNLVKTYPKILIVSVDHVGSRQMASVRHSLRGMATILMGKNTVIRTALQKNFPDSPDVEKVSQCMKLNTGFVFCEADPMEVREVILNNRVPAPARQGVIAPSDVYIPAGSTGLDPSQTSFFQALGISTKIVKGQIEIQNEVHLIKKDDKVTASGATLLQKLNIKPFSYGLKVEKIYDSGAISDASVLDVTDDEILDVMHLGVSYANAMARQLGYPTVLSVDHSMLEGFKNCMALVVDSDYVFPQMEALKNFLENPEAALAATATVTTSSSAAAAEVKQEEPEEEEEDEDMGFSLFD
ncbi:60S acidic ribosomal protein P0 [Theileria orientalis strain Shintoku]|uniref:60S acidic ribosomal protein P0 n=1 Tax=Theileria orientalis strain Shintoku TaxID=869250 RepID=J4DNE2_THEOR|nr:60S acidic ribosomal protein P0 [Theileria orientalis strain Shintoku]PVC52270.1 60S acidic ribosomal protein P0 [Theileria orientalis]BAM38804.1 60S acidic ribosomal protein P0 [Theileria orientalis strain Shintoku]|eukprot:XP_009689105.1 60S acidic ribosomal protein P0 [Theileria orientalis strain Shintoku]